MMKRIFSKKSGFTVLEIVVAFAIFAIMASMILQILNIVLQEKRNNAEYAEKMRMQEELIVKSGRKDDYDESGEKSTLTFGFGEDGEIKADYQMKFPEYIDDEGNAARYDDGLAYYIGPASKKKGSEEPAPYGGAAGSASAGAQMERLDSRITGTRGFESIRIHRVVRDETYSGPGTLYFFEISANANGKIQDDTYVVDPMADEMVPYAQFKMYFCMKDKLDPIKSSYVYTDSEGNQYKREVPAYAKIIDAGYVNDSKLEWNGNCESFSSYDKNSQPTQNRYNIKQLNDYSIRVGTPYTTDWNNGGQRGIRFTPSPFSRFYVIFEEDPQIDKYSFGQSFGSEENVVDNGGTVVYKPVPIMNEDGTATGKNYVNIYGAFEYKKKTD